MEPFPKYPEIVLVDRRPEIFAVKEVVAVEKLHGSNFRLHFPCGMQKLDEVRYGSRETEYGVDPVFPLTKVVNWWKSRENLLGTLWETIRSYGFSDATVFGESFGPGIKAKGIKYSEGTDLLFRSFNIMVGSNFVTHDLFHEIADKAGLPVAPVVWRGAPSLEAFDALLEQPSLVAKENGITDTAEGVVISSQPLLRNVFGEWLIVKHKSKKFSEVAFAPKEKIQREETPVDVFAAKYTTEGRLINTLGRLHDGGTALKGMMADMPIILQAMTADILKEGRHEWAPLGVPDKQLTGAVSKLLGALYREYLGKGDKS